MDGMVEIRDEGTFLSLQSGFAASSMERCFWGSTQQTRKDSQAKAASNEIKQTNNMKKEKFDHAQITHIKWNEL